MIFTATYCDGLMKWDGFECNSWGEAEKTARNHFDKIQNYLKENGTEIQMTKTKMNSLSIEVKK